MNILLISTLAHNPGDEIIRLGQEHVFRQMFPDPRFHTIHKHDPRTLFKGFPHSGSPHRLISPALFRIYSATRGRTQKNYLDWADLVVFAGGPFIWRNQVTMFQASSANAEWVPAIWNRLFTDLADKPVLNLAAGTSVTSKQQMTELIADNTVTQFLKRAIRRSALTTARDMQTQEIAKSIGLNIPLIPCSSILSAQGAGIAPEKPEYVAINVIREAAPSKRGERGNDGHWRRTIEAVVADVEKRHKILFVSHGAEDDRTAAEWFPNHPRLFSMDPKELLKAYSKALFGVCNRVHAGGGLASFARPVIVVGGDSRVDLIRQFGLPAYDHREVEGADLVAKVHDIEANYDRYVNNLRAVIARTERLYVDAISETGLFESPVCAVAAGD